FDGHVLAYSADTAPNEELVNLAHGADVLLAEATWIEVPSWGDPIHMTASEAGQVARQAGAGRLVITHVWPTNPKDTVEERATEARTPREVQAGRPSGRTQEIQRLVGRSLRSVTALEKMGECTIWIDCDVLQADGGTRTASITAGYLALAQAVSRLSAGGALPGDVLP